MIISGLRTYFELDFISKDEAQVFSRYSSITLSTLLMLAGAGMAYIN